MAICKAPAKLWIMTPVVALIALSGFLYLAHSAHSAHDRAVATAAAAMPSYPPYAIQPACPKYIKTVHSEHAGLGHRVMGVVVALQLAAEHGAALVVSDSVWESDGKQGSYLSMRHTTRLDQFASSSSLSPLMSSAFTRAQSDDEARELLQSCHTAIAVASDGKFCRDYDGDDPVYCTLAGSGAYALAQHYLQPPSCCHQLDDTEAADVFTVVWHFRLGDIEAIPTQVVVDSLTEDLIDTAQWAGVQLNHVILSEDMRPFPFDRLLDLGTHYAPPVEDAFKLMQSADVLVATGSSLPLAAAITRCPTAPIVALTPKECVKAVPLYQLPGMISTTDGNLSPFQLELLTKAFKRWRHTRERCHRRDAN